MANTANITSLSIGEIDSLYPTPNSTLTTDLSSSPYYDDYDKTKQYYRILYRPGYAVQARELTQTQTLLQKQIARFGQHVFKEGSIVLPGEFSIELDVDYIKIKDSSPTAVSVDPKSFLNTTLTNDQGVVAYVIDYADTDTTNGHPKTLYVRYTSTAPGNTDAKIFSANNTLTSTQGQVIVSEDANPTGKGSRFVIREGVFFAKEHFIWFPTQSIVLDRYSTSPNVRVGFQVQESIIRYTDDDTLLDPALEASNYSAPGADRLKIEPFLVTKPYDNTETEPDFVELFTIKEGIITELYRRAQYNILQDELAKRTLDESGDYYVRGLGVRIREHLDDNNNGGYLTIDKGGDANALAIGVEPGLAYVKGYERQLYVTKYVKVDKSTDYGNVISQSSTTSMGNYLICNEFGGYVVLDQGNAINLLDGPIKLNSNTNTSPTVVGSAPTSVNVIGTARVKDVQWYDGQLGTPNGQIALYLTDIRMNSGKAFENVKAMNSSTFGADVVLRDGKATLYDAASDTLLYYTGSNHTRSITDQTGNYDMTYLFRRTATSQTIDVNGKLNITLPVIPNETTPYGTQTSLARPDKREIIVTWASTDKAYSTGLTPSSRDTDTTFTLTGASTKFNVGDRIFFTSNTRNYSVTAISGSTITVSDTLPAATNVTGGAVSKYIRYGDVFDLTGYGTSGSERSVATTDSTITIDLQNTVLAGNTCSVTYPVSIEGSAPTQKLLKSNCFVKISLASAPYYDGATANTKGPFSLGFADIFAIRSIRRKDDGTYPSGITDGTDAIYQFTLDNGQRDSYYDFGSIVPRVFDMTSSTRLLVNFDYFEPSFTSGRGYFSVDSYPIDDSADYNPDTEIQTAQIPIYTSSISRLRYNLRNYIDFRPVKLASGTYTSVPGSASINPAFSTTFTYGGGSTSLRFPVPSTQFNFSFSYYLARIDLILMDKDGNIVHVEGTPSTNPLTPETPAGNMSVASLYIAPFPSLAPSYAQYLKRPDLACTSKTLLNIRYTMRDIGVLKDRIINLEYYASLNLLQKDATDMALLDENGLNRFKNGIFVNDFTSHQFGDISNPDYRIIVDPAEKCIRPFFTTESIYYDFLPDESSGVVITNDLITLPYTQVSFLEANSVTSARNVELSSYRFIGNVYLDPDIDVWVNTQTIPDTQIIIGPDGNNIPQPVTTWNDWQTTVTGYYVEPQGPEIRSSDIDKWVYGGYFQSVPNLIKSPNSPRDQRVTQVTEQSRTGTTTTYSLEENKIQIGDRLVDVSLVPYIRPQTIDINGRGFKACTRIYVFFDGERVDQYCAPMTVYEYLLTPEQRTLGYTPANTTFITSNTANAILGNTTSFRIFTPEYGAPIVTDDTGECFLMLTLPNNGEKQFRVGQKEVILTDSITNSIDATTHGKTYFYAQGLTQYKQGTVLTTRSIVPNTTPLFESKSANNVVGYIDNPSCTAYSFYIKAPPGEEGVFLTSVDVWYQRKHPTLGIWYEVREMDNAGNITRTQVPLSETWLTANEIEASETFDETKYTRITFRAPLFLYNDKEYAFVMHTVGLNPEAYVWIARLGEEDVRSGKKYQARPLTGTFYTTNNNMNWNMVDDIDMKIRFNRAKFTTGVPGTAVIGNKGTDKIIIDPYAPIDANINSDLRLISPPVISQVVAPPITIKYGETFVDQQVTLKSNSGYFKNGDSIMCTTTQNTYTILSVRKSSSSCSSSGDCDYTKLSIANNRVSCTNGYFKLIYGSNSVTQRLTGSSSSIKHDLSKIKISMGKVTKCHSHRRSWWNVSTNTWVTYTNTDPRWVETGIDLEVTNYVRLSNGKTITVGEVYQGEYKFKPGEYMVSSTTNTAAYIIGIKDYRYTVIDFEPSYLVFKNTQIFFEMKPTSNGSPGTTQDWHNIFPNRNYYYDKEMAVYSRTNEFTWFSGARTNKVRVTLASSSEYVSPVFDMARAHSIYVDSILNANTFAVGNVSLDYREECLESGGGIANKYISIPITLAEGQDAEDLLVMLTAYRPPNTDVIVFAKFLHREDSDTLAQKLWIPLEKKDETVFSALNNRDDYKEFSYYIPASYLTGPSTDNSSGGEFQYTNSQGILFTGYKYFQIKIALTGTDTAFVPKVADLRCIALQI